MSRRSEQTQPSASRVQARAALDRGRRAPRAQAPEQIPGQLSIEDALAVDDED